MFWTTILCCYTGLLTLAFDRLVCRVSLAGHSTKRLCGLEFSTQIRLVWSRVASRLLDSLVRQEEEERKHSLSDNLGSKPLRLFIHFGFLLPYHTY